MPRDLPPKGLYVALIEIADALEKVEKQFTFYAEEHKNQDKTEKAATNYGYALIAGRALERTLMLIREKYDV